MELCAHYFLFLLFHTGSCVCDWQFGDGGMVRGAGRERGRKFGGMRLHCEGEGFMSQDIYFDSVSLMLLLLMWLFFEGLRVGACVCARACVCVCARARARVCVCLSLLFLFLLEIYIDSTVKNFSTQNKICTKIDHLHPTSNLSKGCDSTYTEISIIHGVHFDQISLSHIDVFIPVW